MIKYQDKRMNIMVNKIGLSEENALWCIEKSKKYSIWLANQMKTTNLRKREHDVDTVLDWKREVQDVNLNELTFKEALNEAREFQNSLFIPNENGLENKNVVIDMGEFKWVQLVTAKDCIEEGNAMGHCIGNGHHSSQIATGKSMAFSLRDKFNRPHITLEATTESKRIFEFKGNSNQLPKVEYLKYFVNLVEKYDLSEITDSSKRVFKEAGEIVRTICKINPNFFDFNFKVSMGLDVFEKGDFCIQDIQMLDVDNNVTIPDETSFYGTLELVSKAKVVLGKDILIGGNLTVTAKEVSLNGKIQVGGNVTISSPSKIKENNNIICFGKKNLIKI
jgi:hypothetical protein